METRPRGTGFPENKHMAVAHGISPETRDREAAVRAKFRAEKGGCAWGTCASCGALPPLRKMATGETVDDPERVAAIKPGMRP